MEEIWGSLWNLILLYPQLIDITFDGGSGGGYEMFGRTLNWTAIVAFGAACVGGGEALASSDSAECDSGSMLIKGRIQVLDSGEKNRLPRPKHHLSAAHRPDKDTNASKEFPMDREWLKSFREIKRRADKAKVPPLAVEELNHLCKYDIAILVDRSASMNLDLDRFQMGKKISRWEWCRLQAESLSKQIATAFPSGITVIPFSNHADRYTNVSAADLNRIFFATDPEGMTMLDEAVGLELDHYLYARSTGTAHKPLLMAVITDGSPNDPQKVVEEILHISRKIKRDEVKIVFFMIGSDPMATAFVDYIRTSRVAAGIPFDIVSTHNFSELNELGLARSLARAVGSPIASVSEQPK